MGKITILCENKGSYVKEKIASWGIQDSLVQLALDTSDDKPWEKSSKYFHKDDIEGEMHIIFADGLYVDIKNMKPRMASQVRRMAAFKNTKYYQQCMTNKRMDL